MENINQFWNCSINGASHVRFFILEFVQYIFYSDWNCWFHYESSVRTLTTLSIHSLLFEFGTYDVPSIIFELMFNYDVIHIRNIAQNFWSVLFHGRVPYFGSEKWKSNNQLFRHMSLLCCGWKTLDNRNLKWSRSYQTRVSGNQNIGLPICICSNDVSWKRYSYFCCFTHRSDEGIRNIEILTTLICLFVLVIVTLRLDACFQCHMVLFVFEFHRNLFIF